jgi:hypothetical protein
MKKYILSFFCFAALSMALFGADIPISAGAGGLLGYTFTRYTLKSGDELKSLQSMDRINYGALLFFDATYGELAIIIQGGNNSYSESMETRVKGGSWNTQSDGKGTGTEQSLGITLLGKYPFEINEKVTWFPLLGLEYQIALLETRQPDGNNAYNRTAGEGPEDRDKDGNPYPLSTWNSLWINLGAGLDYTLTGPFYLRSELLFGFRLQTPYETGALEMTKKTFGASDPKLSGLTGGPTLKICAGYRF